ncbi:hypothetical protein ASO14_1469 [Kurthia sp. 11kri321]|uniref:DUF4430 domain-containing protein n=1 Tax=Kurthia sp. 11kri321 TaxID=1750719 RepID=UPI000745BF37|nr:DUF4430 domain-containing protein [Kurthia sp. 11kri321]AMA62185.1 hypothetical protein ASO14_1469 [Kurthia sp. 11kri321]
MKSKIILFALSATLLLTGCKVQTAQQYENEQEEEAKKVVVLNDEEQKKAKEKEKEETKETAQDDKGSVTKEVAATSENDTTTSTNSSVSTVEKSTSTPSQTQKPEAKKETTTSNNTSKEQPTKTEKPVKKDEPKKETTVTKKPETTTSTPKPSTPKPSTPEKPVEKPAKKEYATITIGMRTLLNPDHYELLPKNLQSEKYVPASGVLLNNAKIEIKEGDTAWDAISKLRSKYGIYINYEKNPMYGIYIIGINHINEKQAGSLSGWMYTVNGVKAPVGVGNYELEDGDRIELQYTTNGGTDLGW